MPGVLGLGLFKGLGFAKVSIKPIQKELSLHGTAWHRRAFLPKLPTAACAAKPGIKDCRRHSYLGFPPCGHAQTLQRCMSAIERPDVVVPGVVDEGTVAEYFSGVAFW